jgi:hypothetical protein
MYESLSLRFLRSQVMFCQKKLIIMKLASDILFLASPSYELLVELLFSQIAFSFSKSTQFFSLSRVKSRIDGSRNWTF